MTNQPPSAIIISDGGLPALVAAAIEAERSLTSGGPPAALMPWPTAAPLAATQFAAAASQARFHRLATADPPRLCAADVAASAGMLDTLCLLAAAESARVLGSRRVIWPVQFHAEYDSLPRHMDRIGDALDRALLVSRLSLLDGAEEIAFETPLVDLTDRQLADLVVDLDAPAYLCWWWRRQAEAEAEACAAPERTAWLAALRDAGWVQADPAVTVPTQPAAAAPDPA